MLFEDIQKEIIRGYKTGERIGFREAVMNLRRCGSVNRGEIEIPDFLSGMYGICRNSEGLWQRFRFRLQGLYR